MTTFEKIKNFISKEDTSNYRYILCFDEISDIIINTSGLFAALRFAFDYGRAKGLQEARAAAKRRNFQQ